MRFRYGIGLLAVVFGLPVAAQELVVNGDFEDGLADWTVWSAPPTAFWNGVWLHQNDCDIWVPPGGCPFGGALSHSQEKGSGAGNAHGGITQPIAVMPGRQYRVTGQWSGGVTGNAAGNATWWEVVVYDGAVTDAIIDQGLRPQDALIDKIEVAGLANLEVMQFDWQAFSGVFTAGSSLATLVFKQGSFSTFDAAAYHDDVSMLLLAQPTLGFTKTAALQVDADGDTRFDRGDTVRYTLVVQNPVDADALDIDNLQVSDVLDPALQLVSGSVVTSAGSVLTGNGLGDAQVLVDVGSLPDGGVVTIQFDAVVDAALSAAIIEVTNQASASGDNIVALLSDDPGTANGGDATAIVIHGVQTITGFMATPANAAVGESVTLSASGGGSGNPVVFASTTPGICSVTGSSVALLVAGTCTVSANQAGNALFNAAPEVTLGIPVGLVPQAITGFGASPLPAISGATATISAVGGGSGNPLVFASATPSICSVAASTVSFLQAGSCQLTANQAGNAQFSAAPQQTLDIVVGLAPQTIAGFTASPLPAQPGASATLSAAGGGSGNPVVFASSTPSICSVAGVSVNFLLPGNCELTANQAGNASFLAAPQVSLSIVIVAGTTVVRSIPTLGAWMLALAALLMAIGGMIGVRSRG